MYDSKYTPPPPAPPHLLHVTYDPFEADDSWVFGMRTARSRNRGAYGMWHAAILPWGVLGQDGMPWHLALQSPTTSMPSAPLTRASCRAAGEGPSLPLTAHDGEPDSSVQASGDMMCPWT